MKKLLIMLLLASTLFAQEYVVEKVKGKVLVQKGTSEKWETVQVGDKLNGDALLVTEENSMVQLNKNGNRFVLEDNSALGLNYIKKISINDLLLALAMEEIRNVPKIKKSNEVKSTAVYGEEVSAGNATTVLENTLGVKKLNGAKLLAENGYKESSVIVAKETYRKYPDTRKRIEDRIYFADILADLGLYQEAASEYASIKNEPMTDKQREMLEKRIEEINLKLVK